MTTIATTIADVDVALVRARWAYLHATWARDSDAVLVAHADIDALLDQRRIIAA